MEDTFCFFFNDSATAEIYTLSLHDALPIWSASALFGNAAGGVISIWSDPTAALDRKSTRLNSSHVSISYAVFCLKKKKTNLNQKPMYLFILNASSKTRCILIEQVSRCKVQS